MPFSLRTLGLTAFWAVLALAGDNDWEGAPYNYLFQFPLPIPPIKQKKYTYRNATSGREIDYYEIEIKPFTQKVYPNLPATRLIGYDGMSPGPTFDIQKGRETVVRFINRGSKADSVHLHGSYSRAPFDGWAEDLTQVGQYKDYYYPNDQSGRMLWYHDHAVHLTTENTYSGQAGLYFIRDPAENALGLPSGKYDVPLALHSKVYRSDGQLSDVSQEEDSLYGDIIHVNGQPWPHFKVEPRKYRLRLLDTSLSRTFSLSFQQDGTTAKIPFNVIGSDAGLLTRPVSTNSLDISMAERWEVVFDFASFAGKNITLRNERDVQADEDFIHIDKVMRFVVGSTVSDTSNNGNLPGTLRQVPFPPNPGTIDRFFRFERGNGEWQINGVTFADINNRILAKPPRGKVEVWQLENNSGGWSHPIHIHLVDFQILSRDGDRPVYPYEKEALKDVVLLGEGETVKVVARYAPWDGLYMFHCHNIVHEDHDMMAAFNVTSLADFGYPETTRLIDPMDQRFRAKPINSGDFTESAIQAKLAQFDSLNVYDNIPQIEEALVDYWN